MHSASASWKLEFSRVYIRTSCTAGRVEPIALSIELPNRLKIPKLYRFTKKDMQCTMTRNSIVNAIGMIVISKQYLF